MELNQEICERARLSRDSRFDGRFYIGVTSTGIYCRPICPVQPPQSKNVVFFPTAAAASESGFRPCLRCHPECAPGTPAWLGTSATVSRALRLIASGALDQGNVEDLANNLGVGSRHLRRLFLQHLGASPLAISKTRRLHFAKRLIDETDLSMIQIALASGYGSVRRFNDTFKKTYQRTPSELRKAALRFRKQDVNTELNLHLPYQAPLSWESLLQFLTLRATPNVEKVQEKSYSRTIELQGKVGSIRVSPLEGQSALQLQVRYPDTEFLFTIVERVRNLFDLDAPVPEIREHLSKSPIFKKGLEQYPGLRVPGAWDPFELLIRAILGQQVSVKGATTLTGRLVQQFGTSLPQDFSPLEEGLTHLFPQAKDLVEAPLEQIGLPKARANTLRASAQAVHSGQVNFNPSQSLESFIHQLSQIHGIGDWTANYVAMRALREPDAFPASDLVLLKTFGTEGKKATPKQLHQAAEEWRPWRAYAAMYLWKSS